MPFGIDDALFYGGAEVALTGLKGLFGGNADDERKKRYRQLMDAYQRAHTAAIQRTAQANAGMVGNARQAAAERAAAGGRTGQAESYILPAEQGAEDVASRRLNEVNQQFDTAELGIEQNFADRPIEPGFFDYAQEALGQFGEYQSNRKLADAYAGPLPQTDIQITPEQAKPPIPEPQPIQDPGTTSTSSLLGQPDLESSTARRYSSTFKRRKKLNANFEEPYNSMFG